MVDELRELGGPTVEEEKEEGKDGEDKEREGLPGRSLKVFDISYNSIRDMEPVCFCPNLQELCEFSNAWVRVQSMQRRHMINKWYFFLCRPRLVL